MTSAKKIVLLGHFGVGKSSLIKRFVSDEFSENYKVTIGVHILKKEVEVAPEKTIALILWDLEGTDDITKVRNAYLLGTHGFVYVFDTTRPSTFSNIEQDIAYIKAQYPNTPLQIIGNKADLVDLKKLERLLKQNNIPYHYLTSAKTGHNVNVLFEELAKDL